MQTLLTSTAVLLILLTVWHLIYQSVILRMIHDSIRTDLLRIKMTLLRISLNDSPRDAQAIIYLGEMTEALEANVAKLWLIEYLNFVKENGDQASKDRVMFMYNEAMTEAGNEQLNAVFVELDKLAAYSLIFNSGGLLTYIAPPLVAAGLIYAMIQSKSVKKVYETFTWMITKSERGAWFEMLAHR